MQTVLNMEKMDWSTNPKKNGNVTFTACSCNGKPLTLRVDEACIQYEPSVFGGMYGN